MWKKYFIAANLSDALHLLNDNPKASKIIAGGTDLMLEIKRGLRPEKQIIIDLSHIAELRMITRDDNGDLHIGALVTHNDAASSTMIQRQARALAEACYQVGSPQIRNRGTIAGNLVTASPANDTIPALLALNAEIVLASTAGERTIPLESFYLGVRKTVLAENEIVKEIIIRAQSLTFATSFYKLALRNAQAISVVNAAVAIKINNSSIKNVIIALGSDAPTVVRLKQLEASLINSSPSTMINLINEAPLVEISPISDVRS
ncbi:MAG: xanthine dehydrogenase family protein subunit M, partial [Anaerolineaceae bacterium]|nr:xanthine dehydrogenase family protein subunit M [Anaerolineaceae bacterium]